MPTTAEGIMGKLLQAFLLVLSGGYSNLLSEAWWLFTAMATLELVACGLLWAFSEYAVIEHLIWKVLAISVTAWLISIWPTLVEAAIKGFIHAGIVAAGQGVVWTVQDFYNPGNIATFGWNAVAVIFKKINDTTGFRAVVDLPYLLTLGVAAWMIVGCYMIIAIAVFVAIVEFYFVSVLALLLMPFSLFRHTAFLAQGVLTMIGSHAVRLLVLAFLTAVMLPVMYTMAPPKDPGFDVTVVFLFGSVTVLAFVLHAPTIANGLVFGYPVMHGGHILGAAGQSASAAALATRAATTAGQGVYQGALGATAGLHAIREAAHIGAASYRQAHPGASSLRSAVQGGSQGAAAYLRHRTLAGFREAAAQGRIGAQQAVPPQASNGQQHQP
jgi:type IV secretion system protein TrbL